MSQSEPILTESDDGLFKFRTMLEDGVVNIEISTTAAYARIYEVSVQQVAAILKKKGIELHG